MRMIRLSFAIRVRCSKKCHLLVLYIMYNVNAHCTVYNCDCEFVGFLFAGSNSILFIHYTLLYIIEFVLSTLIQRIGRRTGTGSRKHLKHVFYCLWLWATWPEN